MSCKSVQSKLSAYLDGEMSGTEMQATREHVNSCRECQAELDGFRSIQMILKGMPSAPEPSEHLPARISQSVASSKRSYLRLSLIFAIPAVVLSFLVYPRPQPSTKIQDRNLAISRQVAQDQIFDSGADSTVGASLVHYTNFEGR